METKFTVLSLFTGIGGLDMGFGKNILVHRNSIADDFLYNIYEDSDIKNFVSLKTKPFESIFQNDILLGAKQLYIVNNKENNYHLGSIYDLLNDESFIFPKADVVIGGFPCNDFSHAGKRQGFKSKTSHDSLGSASDENNRGTLYKCFVEVILRTRPKIFVAENVYGLLTMKTNPIKQIVNDFEDIGYDVKYELIKAEEYGIPQTRWRVIIIGISKERKLNTLEEKWNELTKNKIFCEVGNYLEHLDEPDVSEDISQKIYSKAKKLDKGQGQKEINLHGFAPTIRAEHHGNIEFRRHEDGINQEDLPERRLTIREVGLIQTFPPDYIFNIKKTMESYKYIGNAVPPLLSYIIADKVEELLAIYF